MTAIEELLVTEDEGSATRRLALLGRIGGRWRLLGSAAFPAALPRDAAEDALAERVGDAAAAVGWRGLARLPWSSLPRLVARTRPPDHLAVAGVTVEGAERLVTLASAAGWRPRGVSVARDGVLAVTETLLRPDLRVALVGTEDPPSGEERRGLQVLAALADAASRRRPELTVVAAGAVAEALRSRGRLADGVEVDGGGAAPSPGMVVAPAAGRGEPAGAPLHRFLAALAAPPGDGRRLAAQAAASLARRLGRRLELLDVGASAGTWVVADADGAPPEGVVVARAALVPSPMDDDVVEEVLAWSTAEVERGRLRDRLWELEGDPWADGGIEGGLLRLAAARAALERLMLAGSRLIVGPPPDLTIVTGGPWIPIPAPAVALAIADTVRRPGAAQLTWDHAGLLAPLGALADEAARQALLADLLDDLLVPLGAVVSPGLLAGSGSRGRAIVRGSGGETTVDLVPGALQLVDLPPGEVAEADLQFHRPVLLGRVGRRFHLRVAGGLSGLLFDLRGIPIALPERLERRRQLLAAWQGAFWTGGRDDD